MSDLDRIRTSAEIRAWFEANAGTVTAGLVAERAVRAVLGLHDEATANIFDDAQPVCREDGQDYDGVDLPGCRTTRAIDAEINHVLRGVGVSGGDQPEPTTPTPREPRVWRDDDPEPDPRPRVVTTPDSRERIYAEDWGGWVLRNESPEWETPIQWDDLPKPLTEKLSEVVTPEGTP